MFPDKIYCINLDRRPDRWQQAKEQFDRHKLDVERFAAIDARDFKINYPTDNPNNGCTLSHYFLVERAKLLGLNAIMIFEDDVELHPNFRQLLFKCCDNLPVVSDMIYFGGSHKEKPERVNDYIYKVNKTLTTHGYIIRSSMYNAVIRTFARLDQPVDGLYCELQKVFNVYCANPPLAWQRGGFSDIQQREMHYPHLKSNEQ